MSRLRVRPKSLLDASMFTQDALLAVTIYNGSAAPVLGSTTNRVSAFGRKDLIEDSFKISRQLFSSGSWEVGSANAEQLNLELYNDNGKWRTCLGESDPSASDMKDYSWKNKYLVVELTYFADTPAEERVHIGTFKVTEASVEQYKVSITAIGIISSLDTPIPKERIMRIFLAYMDWKGYSPTTAREIPWSSWFDFVRYYFGYSSATDPSTDLRAINIDVATLRDNLDMMMTRMGHSSVSETVTLNQVRDNVKTIKDLLLIPAMVTGLPYVMGMFLDSDDPYGEYDTDLKYSSQVKYGLTQPVYPVMASVSHQGYVENETFNTFTSTSDSRWESSVGDTVEFTGIRYNKDGDEYLFAGDSTGIVLEVDRTGTHELLRSKMSDSQIETGWYHFFVTSSYLTNFSIKSMNLYDINVGAVLRYRDIWNADHDVLVTACDWRLNRSSTYGSDITGGTSSVATSEVQNTAIGWNNHYNPMMSYRRYVHQSVAIPSSGSFTLLSDRLTNLSPGTYQLTVHCRWGANGTGVRAIRIGKNTSEAPTEYSYNTDRRPAISAYRTFNELVTYVTISSEKDTFDVYVHQNSGSQLTATASIEVLKLFD